MAEPEHRLAGRPTSECRTCAELYYGSQGARPEREASSRRSPAPGGECGTCRALRQAHERHLVGACGWASTCTARASENWLGLGVCAAHLREIEEATPQHVLHARGLALVRWRALTGWELGPDGWVRRPSGRAGA